MAPTSSARSAEISSSSSLGAQRGESSEGRAVGSAPRLTDTGLAWAISSRSQARVWGVAEGFAAGTHAVSDCFSVKTRRTKSASLCGSKVEGTTMYSPGGRRIWLLTSRRLMKVSERARDWFRRKKSFFKCTFWLPWAWGAHALVGNSPARQGPGSGAGTGAQILLPHSPAAAPWRSSGCPARHGPPTLREAAQHPLASQALPAWCESQSPGRAHAALTHSCLVLCSLPRALAA